jgi:hypothetical protein
LRLAGSIAPTSSAASYWSRNRRGAEIATSNCNASWALASLLTVGAIGGCNDPLINLRAPPHGPQAVLRGESQGCQSRRSRRHVRSQVSLCDVPTGKARDHL